MSVYLGIQLIHGFPPLWSTDGRHGSYTPNVYHPYWGLLLETSRTVVRLMGVYTYFVVSAEDENVVGEYEGMMIMALL